MTTDDPKFPRGDLVLITSNPFTSCIAVVIKAIKGREHIRVHMGTYNTPTTVLKENARVITKEDDPELFI